MNTTPLRISFTCPCCNGKGYFNPSLDSFSQVANCTTDCGNCDAVLIVLKNWTVAPFNEYINSCDSRWPKDGKGTSFVCV